MDMTQEIEIRLRGFFIHISHNFQIVYSYLHILNPKCFFNTCNKKYTKIMVYLIIVF